MGSARLSCRCGRFGVGSEEGWRMSGVRRLGGEGVWVGSVSSYVECVSYY